MNLIVMGKHQVTVAGTCLFVEISLMIKLAASQVCCLSKTMNREVGPTNYRYWIFLTEMRKWKGVWIIRVIWWKQLKN